MKKLLKFIDKNIGFAGTIAMIVSYIPQIKLLLDIKDSTGQSVSFWLLLNFALMTTSYKSIQAYRENKTNATLSQLFFVIPNLLCALIMLFLVISFK